MHRVLCCLLALVSLCPLSTTVLWCQEPAPAIAPATAEIKTEGLRVVCIGNSQTHAQQRQAMLSPLIGHPGYQHTDVSILGTSARGNYKTPGNNKWPEKFAKNGPFDVIIVFSREDKSFENNIYAAKWLEEALKTNPRCQMLIQQSGPDVAQDWTNPPWERSMANAEWIAAAVAAAHPNAPKPRIIPESLLRCELGRLADLGQLPGVASHYELMGDGGHMNEIGQYGLLCLTSAMMYQESPLDYPNEIFARDTKGNRITGMYTGITVAPETATVIKRVAWDILQTYPLSGIKAGLIIANRNLEPLVTGQPAQVELKALNAAGACTWSVAKGELPAGFALSAQGVLSGTSNASGEFPVTLAVSDGANTSERPLVITVAKDLPPVIPDQPLPAVGLDRRVLVQLKHETGVGHVTWGFAGGKLPYGVMLTTGGMLVGNPGEAGTFTFSVSATDANPAGPRRTTKEFAWTIAGPAPETLAVKYVYTEETGVLRKEKREDRVLVVDGVLDEPYWKLDQPITKAVQGTPTKKATFGAVWTTEQGSAARTRKKTGAAEGHQLAFAVTVLDGPTGKTPKDGLHIYIDGRHDGTHTYAADDTHFFVPRIPPTTTRSGTLWITGKVNWFVKSVVKEIEGGYVVEGTLKATYFVGEGNWLPFGAKGVYGFDLGLDEGTEGNVARQMWRGDASNDTDTSRFGTIVLIDEPAIPAATK